MKSEHQHTVLVVDGDKQVCETINDLLSKEKINCVLADNGESAMEAIKNAETPFSLIIASETLKGMNGLHLLEDAKKLTPDTGRFLLADSSETGTLVQAVNRVSVQRYIVKPFGEEDLVPAIRSAINHYDSFLDTLALLTLAKKQNTKLYDLNCQLLETTKAHTKMIQSLEHDIQTIKKEIKTLLSPAPDTPDKLFNAIQTHVKNDRGIDPEKLKTLFSGTIKSLYDQFCDLANRNGFELPETGEETK